LASFTPFGAADQVFEAGRYTPPVRSAIETELDQYVSGARSAALPLGATATGGGLGGYATLAGGFLGAAGAIISGFGYADAAEFDIQRLNEEAIVTRQQAQAEEDRRRKIYQGVMGAQVALQAHRGLAVESGGFKNRQSVTTQEFNDDVANLWSTADARARSLGLAAEGLSERADAAKTAALIQGGAAIAVAAASASGFKVLDQGFGAAVEGGSWLWNTVSSWF
jgi:hypothetical protein